MRMIKIPNCEYALFYAIRLEILRKADFALFQTEYLKEDKIAFFHFWDTAYIPEELKTFIVKPPHEPKFDFSNIKLPQEEDQTSIIEFLESEEK